MNLRWKERLEIPTFEAQSGPVFHRWRQLLSTREKLHPIRDINMEAAGRKSPRLYVCPICQVASLAAKFSL